MSGSATFTIVMSSSSMNTPVHTATRVHHLLAMSSSSTKLDVIDDVPGTPHVRGDSTTDWTRLFRHFALDDADFAAGGPQAKLSDVPAPVAQRIEHLTTDQKVRGSNPFRRATL